MVHSSTRFFARAAFGASLLACAVGAQAAIVETISLGSNYSYSFGGPFVSALASNYESIRQQNLSGGAISELGIDLVSNTDNGGFYFLGNAYCVGTCTVTLQTQVVMALTNTGNEAVDLRFDSQITPGHLARLGTSPDYSGNFSFMITQEVPDPTQVIFLPYQAQGVMSGSQTGINTTDTPFNGQTAQGDAASPFEVIDWSATNVNAQLVTVGAGETHFIGYQSTISVSSNAQCTTLEDCPGLQIAFGDPRNNGGGGTNFLNAVRSAGQYIAAIAADDEPVIGRAYNPYRIYADTAPQGSALPPEPEPLPAVSYDPTFVAPPAPTPAPSIPEPASWALMIGGFALAGGALRRKRLALA